MPPSQADRGTYCTLGRGPDPRTEPDGAGRGRTGPDRAGQPASWPTSFLPKPRAWKPPSTMTIDPLVAGNRSDSNATAALATGVGSVVSQPNGARLVQPSSRSENPGIDLAAIVLIGPAATRLTRIPLGPRSRARYRVTDSSAALATPIQS